jgi:hypothetical protein
MIAIIDYGVGNLFSVTSSLQAIGADTVITSDPEIIRKSDKLLLPGVGAFSDAIAKLVESLTGNNWKCRYLQRFQFLVGCHTHPDAVEHVVYTKNVLYRTYYAFAVYDNGTIRTHKKRMGRKDIAFFACKDRCTVMQHYTLPVGYYSRDRLTSLFDTFWQLVGIGAGSPKRYYEYR